VSARDLTSMGGVKRRFETTDWTLILQARTQDEDARRAILGELIGQYWKPVYCYLRRRGYGNDEAKDLTQGFFEQVVLGHSLVQKADPARGRFRNFLLTSLNRYVGGVRRVATSKKRRPQQGWLPLEGLDSFNVPEPAGGVTPEDAFAHDWAASLIQQVLEDVERQCRERGEQVYWQLFYARFLGPFFEGSPVPSLGDLCSRYGIANASRASNMIITVKRRFRAAMERRVRVLVASDGEVEDEIRDLRQALSRTGAGI